MLVAPEASGAVVAPLIAGRGAVVPETAAAIARPCRGGFSLEIVDCGLRNKSEGALLFTRLFAMQSVHVASDARASQTRNSQHEMGGGHGRGAILRRVC